MNSLLASSPTAAGAAAGGAAGAASSPAATAAAVKARSVDETFGPWASASLDELGKSFIGADPFPHVVLDNFFSAETLAGMAAEYPLGDHLTTEGWFRYWNPMEKKFAFNKFEKKPFTKSVIDCLQSDAFVALMKKVSGIMDLESDPHLHGAGLHFHPTGGKLDMHLDYSVHPVSGLERRLNLIVYLNPAWKAEWGGALEFWDAAFTGCRAAPACLYNRAVLFQTSDISYHGIPKPISCPEGEGRQSLAIYYLAPLREGAAQRLKAQYRPLPGQPVRPKHEALYKIRPTRLIAPEDLWEGWETDPAGKGYWW